MTARKRRQMRNRRNRKMRATAPLAMKPRYFRHKLTGVISLGGAPQGQPQPFTQTIVFSRYDYQGIVSNVYGINSADRWAQVKRNYEQYSVTGLAIEYFRVGADGLRPSSTTADMSGTVNYLWKYEDVDTYDVSGYNEQQIVALETFKACSPKHYKVYRNNKPLAQQMKAEWQDCNQSETTANGLPKASIALRFQTEGYQANSLF